MHVCIIGGGGNIGSTLAYTLTITEPAVDISLLDVDTELALAQATDIRHGNCHRSHPVGRSHISSSVGTVFAADSAGVIDEADCIVVTASAPRPSEGAQRGGRQAYLDQNWNIAQEIGTLLAGYDSRPVICVANPMDQMAYGIWYAAGWPRETILGYSLSETARLADWLARFTETTPDRVQCPIMGQHGEYIVPVFSRAMVDDDPIELAPPDRTDALDYVRSIPYEIIEARGPEHSSKWVTARGVGALVSRVLHTDLDEPICLSVPLEGEYGQSDVCLSVPVQLSSSGWTKIFDWDLSQWERDQFAAAGDAVRDSLADRPGI